MLMPPRFSGAAGEVTELWFNVNPVKTLRKRYDAWIKAHLDSKGSHVPRSLRRQEFGNPFPVFRFSKARPIMQPVLAVLPELDGFRCQAIATPVFRKRHRFSGQGLLQPL